MGLSHLLTKERLALSALLVILLALLVRQAATTGVTMDEPNHMLSAHFFWGGDKVYHVPDLAPLLKIATGWVPRTFGLEIADHPRWQSKDEWAAAAAWAEPLRRPMASRRGRLRETPAPRRKLRRGRCHGLRLIGIFGWWAGE